MLLENVEGDENKLCCQMLLYFAALGSIQGVGHIERKISASSTYLVQTVGNRERKELLLYELHLVIMIRHSRIADILTQLGNAEVGH